VSAVRAVGVTLAVLCVVCWVASQQGCVCFARAALYTSSKLEHLLKHATAADPPALCKAYHSDACPCVTPLRPLRQVYQRILKHLAATSPHLVDPVWHK